MGFLSIAFYGTLLFLAVWFVRLFFRQHGLPHGPLPYPLLGNIPSFYKWTHQKLDEMAKQYGTIFTLWFGRTPIIIVNDASAAEQVFVKNGSKFSNRANLINKLVTKRLCRLPYMNYTAKFIRNQTICKSACRDFPAVLNDCLSKEFSLLKDLLDSKSTKRGFDPTDILNDTVMNLLSVIIYGAPVKDATFADFNLPANKSVFNLANTTNSFRWLRVFQIGAYLKFRKYIMHRESVLKKLFERRRSNVVNTDTSTLMDVILKALLDEKIAEYEEEAEILCSDLFFVSIEKLAAALNWMFLYFITWPEIQQQVYDEISNNITDCSFITIEEAIKNPFLRASVYETLRLSAMTPLSTVHETNEVVTLSGHKLPKGTCVCVNLHAIHHSSKYWDDPYQFNPNRFLDSSGKELKDIETIRGFFPFGAGLRKCVGDDLAMKLLIALMANIVLNFHFDISPWHSQPSLTGSSRVILLPHPYHITINRRN